MVCIYKHSFFLGMKHTALAFLVHLAVLSVGGREREKREKKEERVRV